MGLGRPRKSSGDGCWENGWQIRSPITRKVDLGFQESVFLLMVFLLCFIIWYCLKKKEREREREREVCSLVVKTLGLLAGEGVFLAFGSDLWVVSLLCSVSVCECVWWIYGFKRKESRHRRMGKLDCFSFLFLFF